MKGDASCHTYTEQGRENHDLIFNKPIKVGVLFSRRQEITRMAKDWCMKTKANPSPFNIVTAIDALGLLKNKQKD